MEIFGRLKLLVHEQQGLHRKFDQFIQESYVTEDEGVSVCNTYKETISNEL